jgi:hypothetical protein
VLACNCLLAVVNKFNKLTSLLTVLNIWGLLSTFSSENLDVVFATYIKIERLIYANIQNVHEMIQAYEMCATTEPNVRYK